MKKDRRKHDIKSKLIAAICMLLVSSIMMVSSTYAWFTLSTAPEVTGISTAIGANGNLEMALLPGLNGDTPYTSVADALNAIGDATGNQTVVEKNTTWGNLVDLSDSGYGLDQISLFPASLGLSEGKLANYYLGTPQYGSDGRYMGLATAASAAMYRNGTFGTNAFGVRAVGTSSGMSAHELAFRDALSSANDAFNKAITQTKNAIGQGGSALASLAVGKSTGKTEFTQDDVNNLITAYGAVESSLEYIETAMKQYVIAYSLSNGGLNENTYLTTLQLLQNMDLEDMTSYAGTTLTAYIENLVTLKSEVSTSLTDLKAMTGNHQWSEISTYVTALADVDSMLLNNQTISYYMEKDGDGNFTHINELVANMSNLVLEVNASGNADTGIYAKLADFVDTYTAPVTISGIEYSGINVNNLSATMRVNATANPAYLTAAKTAATTYPDNAFGTGGGTSLSDFYGYIVDMAFRTNAAGSSLQLQTDATDRVYADNTGNNPQTMGGGSSMTYSIAGVEGFGTDQLENLMGYIRVVFFNPADNTIYGYARLDAETAVEEGDGTNGYSVTMKLKMWDPEANDGQGTWAESSIITALQQNTAAAVSTLVYLDGEKLTNADVANAELTGTMNIQFSSTAELKPMEYGDLRNGNTEEASEYTVTVNGITASEKVAAGASYSYNIPAEYSGYDIVVKMGGTDITDDAISNGVIAISNVSGNIEIIATAPEASEPAGT